MSANLAGFVAVACYGALLSFRVNVGHKRSVPMSASFAPVVAVMGRGSLRATIVLAVLGAAVGVAVQLLLRHRWASAAFDLGAFLMSFVITRIVFFGAVRLGVAESVALLLAGSFGVGSFAVVEVGFAALSRLAPLTRDERRVCMVLYALLGSAFGLTILVYREINWIAFVAVLLPLALTKREFDRYALARSTLEETVEVLGQLEARSL